MTNWFILPSRINVGGKLLTNHLKEIISYRYVHLTQRCSVFSCGLTLWVSDCSAVVLCQIKQNNLSLPSSQLHVMDETHVINQVKEDVCYVSQQFYKDMDIAQ